MEKNKGVVYATTDEWLKNNRKALAIYAGEWIAFNNSGVIVHNKSGHIVTKEARLTKLDYVLKYVNHLKFQELFAYYLFGFAL